MATAKKKPIPMPTLSSARTGRLNLRIHPELHQWVHDYSDRSGKSISQIIMDHFRALQEAERGADVEQI